MKATLARWVEQGWYGSGKRLLWLWPLGWLVARVARQRLLAFRARGQRPPVPVLVVGNITVGGTGKTPLVVALCQEAQKRGWRVAIISRGYGAKPPQFPWRVEVGQSAQVAGDEPLMLAQKTGVPVYIAPERAQALNAALEEKPHLIISDDGLQHYGLPRSAEIVVLDGVRGLGNGRCLPAGPLREPAERLQEVDWLVANGGEFPGATTMILAPTVFWQPSTGARLQPEEFLQQYPEVHAMAGIGHPERFFRTLAALGLKQHPHGFPDHHAYSVEELQFEPPFPVVMTEKDAVKAAPLLGQRAWVLLVEAKLPGEFFEAVFERLRKEKNP